MRFDNLLLAQQRDIEYHKELEVGKVYIIDFSESRQLQLGPSHQPPIDLPQSIIPKPLKMQRLDPYSFDVYCLGRVLDSTLEVRVLCWPPNATTADRTAYSSFTGPGRHLGFWSAMHSGSSGMNGDALVSVTADRPLDEHVKSLLYCSGQYED